jgi:hypothetical protein
MLPEIASALPPMENLNTNIKAILVAIVILVFTYLYYANKGGNFVSLGAVVAFAAIGFLALIACFFLVKLVNYCYIKELVYPHLLFRILLPFLVVSLVFWLIYGLVNVSPFSLFADFRNSIKGFFTYHLPYIAICVAVTWLILSLPLEYQEIVRNKLFYNNLKVSGGLTAAFVLSIFIFYQVNKISQPALDVKYNAYKSLDELPQSENYKIEFLLDAAQYNYISEPYLLDSRQEVIINFLYSSGNKIPPLMKSFRIGRSGKILDSLDTNGLLPQNEPITFEAGYLQSRQLQKVITWVFDESKEAKDRNELKTREDWKIAAIEQDNEDLKFDYFHKTAEVHCNTKPDIKWNGTKYYHIIKNSDTLKIKLDDIYHTADNGKNCDEKTLEYFKCKGMDFDLIRLNERVYYVIKPRR